MILVEYYNGLFPIPHDMCQVSEGNNSPLVDDALLAWLKENNLPVWFSGVLIDWDYSTNNYIYSPYEQSLVDMTVGLFSMTSSSHIYLVFNNDKDAELFQSQWSIPRK